MAIDRHVVGRIGEDQVGALCAHQPCDIICGARITAQQPVFPELPEITGPGHRIIGQLRDTILRTIGCCLCRLVDGQIDLGQREAGEDHVELQVDEGLQLDGEDLHVPAGIER
jgi:hypothetical protein